MSTTELHSGSLLKHGEYRIERSLGQGGFGITYQAEQVSLGRKVAIKEFFMKDYCERDGSTSHVTLGTTSGSRELVEKFRQKFVREARMIAGLDHEHIVKIHDVFEENGTAYYVMEYLGGGSLGEGVKAGKAMPEREAISSIRQIASALEYLHKKGIIHFDVKPSNVLRTEDGKLKLIDFGISKHYDESGVQTSSTPVGISKGYAPLEQYQQGSDIRSFTPATDIYSLGATLYALLTGSNPPEASVVGEDGLPSKPANVSSQSWNAVEQAMSFRRKDRPQNVAEFLNLLDGPSNSEGAETTIISGVKTKSAETVEMQKPDKPQKPDNPKPPRKGFPKWLIGAIAGVAAAVIAAVCILQSVPRGGIVFFDSEPQGAEVWLDGADSVGRTPCTLSSIPYGSHSVTYKLSGYCEYNDSIEVSGRKQVDYSGTLTVAYGRLGVSGTPAGMEIFIDGVSTGMKTGKKTVVIDSVPVGAHKVELKLKQYKDCQLEVTVNENETSALTAKAEYDWPAPSGKENGHDYMDLGLSVKWATTNVGASSPSDYGSYFAWGETSPKSDYSWSTLKYSNDTSGNSFSKYNQNQGGTKDNKTVLDLSDDAARSNWGGSWRMPTDAEFQELIDKCTWTWTTMNGKNGYKVASKSNGNSIFLPAAGWRYGTSLLNAGSSGYYWSSSLGESDSYNARSLGFDSDGHYTSSDYRCVGHSVRPVFR